MARRTAALRLATHRPVRGSGRSARVIVPPFAIVTVRGPSMSATPGKVLIDGVTEIEGRKVFVLKFLQGRDPEWAGRVFFADYDENATWLDDLRPAFGERRFFYEDSLEVLKQRA